MAYMTSSGNATVDAMGQFAITGNITPVQWYKTILRENGKPHLLAITILSDLVYWFRPTELRDERSGQIIGWKKKFSGEKLQKSYKQYENLLGESKRTIKAAFDVLVELGVIMREFKEVKITSKGMEINEEGNASDDSSDSKILYNVMFIDLNIEKLNALTYPVQCEESPENEDSLGVVQNNVGGGTKFCTTSDKILYEVPQNIVGGPAEFCMTSLQKNVPGGTKNCGTNTETTTQIINTESNISLSLSNHIENREVQKNDVDDDVDIDIDAITEEVNDLIAFELLYTDFDEPGVEYDITEAEFSAILKEVRDVLVYEVFAAPDNKRFNFGTKQEPDYKSNAIVKNVFRKHLGYGTMKTYIGQFLNNATNVKRVTMYHIKSLYVQCFTQSSQYMSGKRSFYAQEAMK